MSFTWCDVVFDFPPRQHGGVCEAGGAAQAPPKGEHHLSGREELGRSRRKGDREQLVFEVDMDDDARLPRGRANEVAASAPVAAAARPGGECSVLEDDDFMCSPEDLAAARGSWTEQVGSGALRLRLQQLRLRSRHHRNRRARVLRLRGVITASCTCADATLTVPPACLLCAEQHPFVKCVDSVRGSDWEPEHPWCTRQRSDSLLESSGLGRHSVESLHSSSSSRFSSRFSPRSCSSTLSPSSTF